MDTGTGFTSPPSTSTAPLRTTGVKRPGMAQEARTASSTLPCRSQSSRPEFSSVATPPRTGSADRDLPVLEDGAKQREKTRAANEAAAPGQVHEPDHRGPRKPGHPRFKLIKHGA